MVAAALLSASAPTVSRAANLYWDNDANAANNVVATGAGLGAAGTWATADTKWFDPLNPATDLAWNNTNKDIAYFVGSGGAVTLSNDFTVGGLVFTGVTSGQYSIDAGTLTLAAPTGINSPSISVNTAVRATISSVLAGSNGFAKTGNGTLVLTNNSNSLEGGIFIKSGALVVTSAAQLGAGIRPIAVTGVSVTGNSNFSGGSLVVQAPDVLAGLTFNRVISASGRGPGSYNGSGAVISVGNNTFTGTVGIGSAQAETRFTTVFGKTTLAGDVHLGASNTAVFFGNGNVIISGLINNHDYAQDRIVKTGQIYGTTLWLQNDQNAITSGIRIDSGTVRVASAGALGLNTSRLAIDLNNGALEVRSDVLNSFAQKDVNVRNDTNGILFVDHALGSAAVGGIFQFGDLGALRGNSNFFFRGRNGFGATFTGLNNLIGGGGANSVSVNNESNGLLTLNANQIWSQADTTARTLTITGNGDTLVTGSILASATIAHAVTKQSRSDTPSTGTLTILGTASTFIGSFNANAGTTVIRGFGALGAALGGATQMNGGAISYLGAATTGAGETTSKVINLTGTTGAGFLYANQSGSAPTALIISNGVAATGAGIKNFYLGGNAPASVVNELRGVIQENTTTNKTSLIKLGASTWLYVPAAANYSSVAPTGITVSSGGAAQTNNFVVSSATGIVPGMTVSGGNVPASSIVTAVSGTTVYINNSVATTIAASTALTFGTIANFTGNVTVTGGTLQLRPTAATGSGSDVITNGSALSFAADGIQGAGFAGGVFEYQGSAAGGTLTETIGALSANAGLGVVRVTANGGTPTLNLASYATRTAGAALRLEPGTGTSLQFAAVPTAVSAGVLSGTYFLSPAGALDFVATPASANTNVAALGSTTDLAGAGAGAATGNYFLSSAVNSAALLANTIRISGASASLALTGELKITSASATVLGGILHDNALGAATISGSTIATSANEELFLVTGGTVNTNALTISSVLAQGGGGLNKAGSGLLVLTGSNTFRGAVSLNEGTLRVSGATVGLLGLPNAGVVHALRQGTTLEINTAGALAAPYAGATQIPTLIMALTNGSGTITNQGVGAQAIQFGGAANGTGNGVLLSVLSDGSGKLTIIKTGPGVQALTGLNTYTGATVVNGGTLAITSLANIGQPSSIGAGDATSDATNAASLVLSGGARLLYTGAAKKTYDGLNLDVYQTTQTPSVATNRLFTMLGDVILGIDGTYGNNVQTGTTVNNNAALVFSNTGNIQFGGNFTGTRTLTLAGNSSGDNRINFKLTDSPDGVGKLSVARSGWTSWWTLGNAANTYSGDTILSGGALVAIDGASLPTASNLVFADYAGGFQSAGTFNRTLGTGPGQWRARPTHATAGFAADAAPLTVDWTLLNNPVWSASSSGTANFLRGGVFSLNTSTSLADIVVKGNFVISPPTGGTAAFPAMASGATSVTLSSGDVANFSVGQVISGIANLPPNTYITGFDTEKIIRFSNATTGATVPGTATIAGGGWHDINVNDNSFTGLDFATISGVISGTGNLGKQGGGTLILGNANTYSGNTILRNEQLVVSSIGAAGVTASSLGTNSGGWLELGNPGGGNTVTLSYVGPGEITTRAIYLAGTTGSRRIESSGSGPLTLTNVVNTSATNGLTSLTSTSDRMLELRGVNTDFNTVTSNLANASSGQALKVYKADQGIWVLSGTNTYTGATRVDGGSLGFTSVAAMGLQPNAGGISGAVANSVTVALTTGSTTNLAVGTYVNGPGISFADTVATVTGVTGFTLSTARTIANGSEIVFGGILLNNGAIFSADPAGLTITQPIIINNNAAGGFTGSAPITVSANVYKTAGGQDSTFTNSLENGAVLTINGNYVNWQNDTNTRALNVRGQGAKTVWNGLIANSAPANGPTRLSVNIPNSSIFQLTGSSPNTFNGGFILTQGDLRLSKAGALGTGFLQLDGGTVRGDNIVLTGASKITNKVQLTGEASKFIGSDSIEVGGVFTLAGATRYIFNDISGAGTLTLSGGVNLTDDTTARILVIVGSGVTNFSSVIANGTTALSALYSRGTGTLNFTAANTFTGQLRMDRGLAVVSGAGSFLTVGTTDAAGIFVRNKAEFTLDNNVQNVVGGRIAGRAVSLENGALFRLIGNASGTTETAGALFLREGGGRILMSGTGTNVLTFASIGYNNSASVLDLYGITGLGVGNQVRLTTAPTHANLVGGVEGRIGIAGDDFAAYSAASNANIVAFSGYSAATTLAGAAAVPTATAKVTSSYTADDLTATLSTLNALAVSDATARNISAPAYSTLTLTSGNLLFGRALGASPVTHTLSVPRLDLGSAATPIKGYFQVMNGVTVDLTGQVTAGSDVIKMGAGTLLLSSRQYWTGQTGITGGTVKLGLNNAIFGAGQFYFVNALGGTFDLNGFTQFTGYHISAGTTDGGGLVTSSTGNGTLVTNLHSADAPFNGTTSGVNVNFGRVGGYTYTMTGALGHGGITAFLGGSNTLTDDGSLLNTSELILNYSTFTIDTNGNVKRINNNRVNDSAPVTMRGGSLIYSGIAREDVGERFSALTIAQGGNTLTANSGGGDFVTTFLSFPSLTRAADTTVNFTGSSLGQPGSAARIVFDTPLGSQPNGIIGAWAIANWTDYAAYDPLNGVGVVGQGGFGAYDSTFGSGKNTQLVAVQDTTTPLSAGGATAAVLKFAGRASHRLTFAAPTDVLNLQYGGLLRSNDAFDTIIGSLTSRGVLTAGGSEVSGVRELVIFNNAKGNPTYVNNTNNTNFANITAGSAIVTGINAFGLRPGMTVTNANFIAGTTVVSVDTDNQVTLSNNATAGGNNQTLTGVSTFGGGVTTLNSTEVTMNSTVGIGSGMTITGTGIPVGAYVVSVDGPTRVTISRPAISTQTAQTWTVGLSELVIHSVIANNGSGNSVRLVKSGEGTMTLTAANTYTGGTVVNQGVVNATATANGIIVIPAGGVTVNGGSSGAFAHLNVLSQGAVDATNDVTINGSGRVTFPTLTTNTLNSLTFNNIGGESGGSNLSYVGIGTSSVLRLTSLTPITATSSNARIVSAINEGLLSLATGVNVFNIAGIRLPGQAGIYADITPTISIGANIGGVGVSVTKTGDGLLQLAGQNTFTGGLTVSAGGIVLASNSSSVQGGLSLTSGPLGAGSVSFASGTRLLVNDVDRAVGNNITFVGLPTFDSTGINRRVLTLNGSVVLSQAAGVAPVRIDSPYLTVALLGVIPNIAQINSFQVQGPGRLVFNSAGFTGNFNATALGNSSSVSLLHDGNGLPQFETVTLPGAVQFDAGIIPAITVGRAGGEFTKGFGANKLIAVGSITNLASGLTVTNNNGYGLKATGDIALLSTPTFSVVTASASSATHGLELAGVLSGGFGLTKTGNGALVLSNPANSFTGLVDITAGIVSAGSDATLGNASNSVRLNTNLATGAGFRATGTFSSARTFNLNTSNNAIEVTAGNVLTLSSPFTFAAVANNLYKNDNGILNLTADNSAWTTGGLVINAGAVRLGNSLAAGPASKAITLVSTNTGAALQLAGGITVANPLTAGGTNNLFGGINFGGILQNVSGNNTYSGLISVTNDTVIGSTGGTLTISGGIQNNGTNSRQLYFNTSGGDITLAGTKLSVGGSVTEFTYIQKYGNGNLYITNLQDVKIATNNFFMIRQGSVILNGGGYLNLPTDSQTYIDNGGKLILDDSAYSGDMASHLTANGRLGTGSANADKMTFRGGELIIKATANINGRGEQLFEHIGAPTFQRGYSAIRLESPADQNGILLGIYGAHNAVTNAQNNGTTPPTAASVLFTGTRNFGVSSIGQNSAVMFLGGGATFTGRAGTGQEKSIFPWAVFGRSDGEGTFSEGYSFATVTTTTAGTFDNLDRIIRPLLEYEYLDNATTLLADKNLRYLNGLTNSITATPVPRDPNSITIDGSSSITMSAGVRLALQSGGILVRNGSTSTIAGGFINQINTLAPLNLWVIGSAQLTVSSSMNGGNGVNNFAASAVKAGGGTLIIAPAKSTINGLTAIGTNSLSGQFVINQGTVKLGTAIRNAIQANNVLSIPGGTLDLNGNSQQIYSLSSDQAYANSNGIITSSAVGGHLLVNQNAGDQNFPGSFAGTMNLTRSGFNNLVLYTASTMTGSAIFNGGATLLRDEAAFTGISALEVNFARLQLDNGANSRNGVANRIKDEAPVTLRGATLDLVGRAQTATTETIGVVSLLQGNSFIISTVGGTGVNSVDLTLAGLNRTTGQGTVTFRADNGGQIGSFPRIHIGAINGVPTTTLGAGLTNDIIGGWAIFANNANPSDWATYLPGVGVGFLGQTGFPAYAAATSLSDITASTDNVKLGTTVSYLSVDTSVNSINTNAVAVGTIDIAANKKLTVTSGGILSFTNNNWRIGDIASQGKLTSGSSELFLYAQGSGVLTVNSVITGTNNVVKYGAGPVTLAGANDYTGGTTVLAGTLTVATTASIPKATSDITKGLVITGASVAGTSTATTVSLTRSGAVHPDNIVTLNGMAAINYWGNNTQAGLVFNNLGGLITPVVNTFTNTAASIAAFGIGGDNGILTIGSSGIVAHSANVGAISTINGRVDFGTSANTITVHPINVNGVTDVNPLMAGLALQTIVGSTGGITKNGNGVLQLNSQSIFTGSLTIAAGGLKNGANVSLSIVSAVNGVANAGSRFARLNLMADTRYDLNNASTTWGSLEGSGDVFSSLNALAATPTATLAVGYDNSSVSFSGRFMRFNAGVFPLITKIGTGVWTLNGTQHATDGSTGTISVNGGTLRYADAGKAFVGTNATDFGTITANANGILDLKNNGTANVNHRLGMNAFGTLNIQGGRVTVGGNSTVATSETIANLNVVNGGGRLELTPNAAQALTFTITTLSGGNSTGTMVVGGITGAASGANVANLVITTPAFVGSQGGTANGTSTMSVRGDILADSEVSGPSSLGDGFLVKDSATNNWRALGFSSAGLAVAGEFNLTPSTWTATSNANAAITGSAITLDTNRFVNTLTTSGTASIGSAFDAAVFGNYAPTGTLLTQSFSGATAFLVKDGSLGINVGSFTSGTAVTIIGHVLAGATLDVNGFFGIKSTQGFVKADGGAMTLKKAAFYTGNTSVNGGTLNLDSGVANTLAVVPTAGAATVSNLYLNAPSVVVDLKNKSQAVGIFGSLNSAYQGGSGTLRNSGATVVDFTTVVPVNNTASFGGTLAGALNFNRVGPGTTVLTGVNTYSGKTVVRGGILTLRDQGSITSTAGLELHYGQLYLDNWSLTTIADLTPTRIAATNAISMQGGSIRLDSGGGTDTTITFNDLTLGRGNNSITTNVYQGSGSSLALGLTNVKYSTASKGAFQVSSFTTLNTNGASTAGGQGMNSSRVLINNIKVDGADYAPIRRILTGAVTTAGSNVITGVSTAALGLVAGMNITNISGITGTAKIASFTADSITVNLAGTTGTVTASTTNNLDVDNLTNGLIAGWFIANGDSFATYDSVYGVSDLGATRGAYVARAYDTGAINGTTVITGNYNDGTTYNSGNALTTGVKRFNTVRLVPGANSTITPIAGTSYEFGVGFLTNADRAIIWDAFDTSNTMRGLGTDLYVFINQNTTTIRTQIIGTAALNFQGNATLSLDPTKASNIYSGGTYVNAGTLSLNGTAGLIAVPGDLFVTNGAVTMSTTANRIAASSNVTFNGYGRMTLANYGTATPQTLASLTFNNDGGNGDPALIYGAPTALSTIILSATNAITSTNNSLSTTPSVTVTAANVANSALQFSAANPVITVNDGLAATGLHIAVPITQHVNMISLTKVGAGTLALSAANTFTSPFTVSEGSILLGIDSTGTVNAPTNGPVGRGILTLANNTTLLSNAELRVIGNEVVAQGNFTFGGMNQLNNVTLSGNVTLSSATATISVPSPAVTATLNGIITTSAPLGGTGLTKTGNGTLVFGASSSLVLNTGAGLRVSGGIVKAGKAQQVTGASLLTVDALAGYDLNGFDHTLNQIAGGGFITNSAASTHTLTLGDATDYAFDGIFADNFAGSTSSKLNLTKVGSGMLTLTGGNIHNGGTTISEGTVKISGTGLIGSAAVSVAAGSAIDFARAGTYTLTNDFSGFGAMNVTGAGGVAKLLGIAATTNIKITGGTLQVGDGGSVGSIAGTGTLKIGVGATLKFNRTGTFTLNRALQDNVVNQLPGFIVQDGPGKTILTANNSSFTGDVRVSNGVLEAAGTDSLVNVRQITVDTLGTLLVSSDDALGFGPGPNVILDGGTMNLLATGVVSAFGPVNNLTLSGGIISSGTTDSNSTNSLFVTGAVSVTENSTISAQKVGFVNWVSGTPSFVATDISVANGRTLDVSGTIADDAFGNASSFNKKGPGTMILSGNNSGMSGQVTVSEGTVVVQHANALGNGATDGNSGLVNAVTIASAGHVASNAATFTAPAPIATSITVNSGGYLGVGDAAIGNLKTSSLKLNGGAFVEFKIWDRMQGAGVGYDKLDLGAMDLSGASSVNRIKIKLISMSSATALGNAVNFAPLSFGTFDFGTYSSATGSGNISDVFTFDTSDFNYTGGAGTNSGLWSISFNAGAVTLTSVPEPSTYGFGLGVLALAAAAIRRRKRQEKKA